MEADQTVGADIERFIADWTEKGDGPARRALRLLLTRLDFLGDTEVEFVARRGVSHSLRVRREGQTGRPLFMLVDVVGQEPAERWLSVCFYGDAIHDPEEKGNLVPGGLLGEDGLCFDVDGEDAGLLEYVARRVEEAHLAAV